MARAPTLLPALLLALLPTLLTVLAAPARAAATGDEILRQSLMKAYTREDAQRRYTATQQDRRGFTPAAQATGVGASLGNLGNALAGMAARNQERANAEQGLYNAMNDAVEKRQEYPLETVRDAETMKKVLDARAARDDAWAQRRLIEYQLHLRPNADAFFPKRDLAGAVEALRPLAYGNAPDGWGALMMAKLYVAGVGVPRDEGEAVRLLEDCAQPARDGPMAGAAEVVSCRVMLAILHRNGWGYPVNEAEGALMLALARAAYEANFKAPISDAALVATFR
jgi:hypothetical protein